MDKETRDRRDLYACARDYLAMKRCHGGRIIVDGYRCSHCGSEDPETICHGKHKKLPRDTQDRR